MRQSKAGPVFSQTEKHCLEWGHPGEFVQGPGRDACRGCVQRKPAWSWRMFLSLHTDKLVGLLATRKGLSDFLPLPPRFLKFLHQGPKSLVSLWEEQLKKQISCLSQENMQWCYSLHSAMHLKSLGSTKGGRRMQEPMTLRRRWGSGAGKVRERWEWAPKIKSALFTSPHHPTRWVLPTLADGSAEEWWSRLPCLWQSIASEFDLQTCNACNSWPVNLLFIHFHGCAVFQCGYRGNLWRSARCSSVRFTPSYIVYNKEFSWSLFLVPGRESLTPWNFLHDVCLC